MTYERSCWSITEKTYRETPKVCVSAKRKVAVPRDYLHSFNVQYYQSVDFDDQGIQEEEEEEEDPDGKKQKTR